MAYIHVYLFQHLNFPKRKRPPLKKVPSGSLLSRAGHFLGPSRGGPVSSQVAQFSALAGTQSPSTWFDQQGHGKEQPSKEQPERSSGVRGLPGRRWEIFKKNQPGTS